MTLATAVLAGGLGSRISPVTGGRIPKVLVDVGGRPFLDRKLDELAAQGVSDVLLLLGHQAAMVRDHLAGRARTDLRITCVDDGPGLLGTGGALAHALDLLPPAFFVTYGDTLLDQSMADVEDAFFRSGCPALMTVTENHDRGQPSNVTIAGGLVVRYSKGEPAGTHAHLDYGLLVFTRQAFDGVPAGGYADLAAVIASLVPAGRMAAMVVAEKYHDVGTPEALVETASRYGTSGESCSMT